MATFDISTLRAADTADITITNPDTGEEVPGVVFTIYGQDSDVYLAAQRRMQSKFSDYKNKHRQKDMPPSASDECYKQLIIECTKSVKGLTCDGEEITDPKVAYNLSGLGWIFRQIATSMNDYANFIKGLSAK